MISLTKNKISYLAVLFISYGLIFLALYFILGRKLVSHADLLKAKLSLQAREIDETRELVKAIPNPEKEIATVEEKIRELRDKAVTKEQVPRIIQQLTRKSSDLSINIISIRPLAQEEDSAERLAQAVNKVYIEVVMSCPYSAMGDYLKALTELPILFTVESVNIQKKEGEPGGRGTASTKGSEVLVSILLSTYMVLEI